MVGGARQSSELGAFGSTLNDVLTVTELRRIAQSMKSEAFDRQLGPFVLVQRPPDEMTRQRALLLGTKRTIAHDRDAARFSLLFEFDDLLIATLPPVRDLEAMTIGRLPDCEVVIDDPSVSKHHARIMWRQTNGHVTIEDLSSSNGTWVNDARVDGAALIQDGDDVAFGDARYCFLLTRTLYERLRSHH